MMMSLQNSPVHTRIGDDEKGEAPLSVEGPLVLQCISLVLRLGLECVCLVLGLVHGLGEDGDLGQQLRLLGAARVPHGSGPRRHGARRLGALAVTRVPDNPSSYFPEQKVTTDMLQNGRVNIK